MESSQLGRSGHDLGQQRPGLEAGLDDHEPRIVADHELGQD